MQETWLKQEGNKDVVIYMLGWAATPNAVLHIDPPGCDAIAYYNYDTLQEIPAERFADYRRIYLFAWSFGIWVAEQCCRKLPLYKAVALNGTPFPVDERYGMRLRVVLRTMKRIMALGNNPSPPAAGDETRSMPQGPYPEPSPAEKVAELERLSEWSLADSGEHLRWNKAYIATKDEIFPIDRMRAYWSQKGLGTEFESFHYPFANPAIVLGELT